MNEVSKPEVDEYKKINPESDMSPQEARQYWDDFFNDTSKKESELDESEADESDNKEKNIEQTLDDYFKDLKEKSDCPDTIPDKPFEASDLEKRTPEENAEMRDEFDDKKADLKREWEEANGRPWPKYEKRAVIMMHTIFSHLVWVGKMRRAILLRYMRRYIMTNRGFMH